MGNGVQQQASTATARRGVGAGHPVDASGHDASHACANCGTHLIGAHCHACGQAAHVHKTIGAFFHDVAHGVFHFEGKVWRTLPMLATKPGQLTRRYIDGERVRFVSPMALFLFSVFLMFASLGLFASAANIGLGRSLTAINADLNKQRVEAEQTIAELGAERKTAQAGRDPAEVGNIDRKLADAQRERRALVAAQASLGDTTLGRAKALDVKTGFHWIDAKVEHAFANPELTLYKLKTAAYKYSWALIPLSLPFIWLLFPFSRRFGFYDHAIFATYSLSFMTLLIVAVSVLVYAGATANTMVFAAMLIAPIHMYKQVKGTYLLGRWSALARTALLLVFTVFTLTLFGLLLGWLGLA